MSRKPILAGNWKMHNTTSEALGLIRKLAINAGQLRDREVVVCPSFTVLKLAAEALSGSRIRLGAQNLYPEPKGAFTGEVSPIQLVDAGVTFVILGHSERRHIMGESDEFVLRKVKSALAHGLTPIVCVGETLEERESGRTPDVVTGQLTGSLKDLSAQELQKIVIAYEPGWAIGTGKTAKPEQAQEVHALIRRWLAGKCKDQSELIRILYGGSVKPDNIDELMAQMDIDGALVGGASLDAESFTRIVRYK